QLEQTVTKLQIALGFTADQVSALPGPFAKIQELEQENARLLTEIDQIHATFSASPSDFTCSRSISPTLYSGSAASDSKVASIFEATADLFAN
ncbi:hypothetical protein B0H19DRAFT_920722, partial [Mycena capillaripes]